MARPLRSWSMLRFARVRPAVESLEDRKLMAASLVTFNATGVAGANNDSTDPDISTNGRFVVFASRATDLVSTDTNATQDIFLRDLQTGVTQLISVSSNGLGTGNADSSDPSVSDNGRYVVFTSTANNLVAGDTNGDSDVFLRDVFSGTTTFISANFNNNGPGNADSLQGEVSADGRFAVFASDATNINATDLTTTRDVFVRDIVNNTTSTISRVFTSGPTNGQSGNGPSQSPSISADGQYIAFVSSATNFGTIAPGPGQNVYVFDSAVDPLALPFVNPLTLASTTGVAGTGGSADLTTGEPSISDDGQYVAFASSSTTLVPGDINGVSDIFRADLGFGTVAIALVSQSTDGVFANGPSAHPSISGDGSVVTFSSTATNLSPLDINAGSDVFIRDVEELTTALVSVNLAGTGSSSSAAEPVMTSDASLVVYESNATNLTPDSVSASNTNIFIQTTPLPGNDVVPPTFSVPTQPAQPEVGDTVLKFFVTYSDNTAIDTATLTDLDLTVTGPNGFSEQATFFSLIGDAGATVTAAYTVPAPGGTLSSEDNGTYTVTLRGGQIADVNRNFATTGSVGQFTLTIPASETVLPVPTFFGGTAPPFTDTYDFTVVYSERGGVDFATFGNDDVVVTGPNGFTQNASFVASTALSATTTSVIYRINAPGGTFDATDVGTYTVSVLPGGVLDVAGNAVQAGGFGQFTALGADLIAIPLRGLRLGAISGIDTQKAKLRVLNQGSFPTTVPIAITLYTSTDQTLDAGDATIGTFIEDRPVEPDDFRQLNVKFTYPQVPEGNYYILSQVDSANAVIEQSETNNVIASFKQVGLSAPFIDLVPTLIPFTGNRSRLGRNEVSFRLRNAGNVPVVADLIVGLTAISDVTPEPSERPIANIPTAVILKPGQSKLFRLPFEFPIEFERGTYRMVATIDSTNIVPERNDVNNRVISLAEFNFA